MHCPPPPTLEVLESVLAKRGLGLRRELVTPSVRTQQCSLSRDQRRCATCAMRAALAVCGRFQHESSSPCYRSSGGWVECSRLSESAASCGATSSADTTSRDCLLVKPDCQIAPAAQPFVVFRPVANVVLLLLRVLVLAALGILHARTYLGHHHRRISLSARAVQQRLCTPTSLFMAFADTGRPTDTSVPITLKLTSRSRRVGLYSPHGYVGSTRW